MEKQNKDSLNFSNYIAAFIDILGQQERLAKFSILPDKNDSEQYNRFVSMVQDTIMVVHDLHNTCTRFFKVYCKQAVIKEIPEDKKQIYDDLRKTNIKFERFSDGLVVFLSIAKNIVRSPANGIFGLLGACGYMSLQWLAKNHPIRGGIDFGWGTEIKDGELYGSVVQKSYVLESKFAQYPRIVVGNDLVIYLQRLRSANGNDIYTQFNRAVATSCLDLLTVDEDGIMIVDYLGQSFKDNIFTRLDPLVVKKAFQFVLDQCVYWGKRKNTKLVSRYVMLRDYFAHRWPIWLNEKDLPKSQVDTDDR